MNGQHCYIPLFMFRMSLWRKTFQTRKSTWFKKNSYIYSLKSVVKSKMSVTFCSVCWEERLKCTKLSCSAECKNWRLVFDDSYVGISDLLTPNPYSQGRHFPKCSCVSGVSIGQACGNVVSMFDNFPVQPDVYDVCVRKVRYLVLYVTFISKWAME